MFLFNIVEYTNRNRPILAILGDFSGCIGALGMEMMAR